MEQEDGKTGRFLGDGSDVVSGACIEVHRPLDPGVLLESAYVAELRDGLLMNSHSTAIKHERLRLTLSEIFPSSRLPVNSQSSPQGPR